ncbi:hypothetical protein pb186bvf_020767 [Paramecium bursaria]
MIFILFSLSTAQLRTSTNTCTNEKQVFKLDIRQRVNDLPPEKAYMYDYIWLYQLWIPGRYNYKMVNGSAYQTNDYRELQSIKEYLIDPELGSLTDLYHFQLNIKNYCSHMKFLGEFSFYISEDSYLLQNISRFLRRPVSDNVNIYNSRYDNDNYCVGIPWNYFDPIVLNDMKDIIYRLIIQQHMLDGIVFLQPSLGLYNFAIKNYQNEIQYYGKSQYYQDFYTNIGLKYQVLDLFYMGAWVQKIIQTQSQFY